MRRDPELIRKLVLAIEANDGFVLDQYVIEGHTEEQVGYHSFLLCDAELAEGISVKTMSDPLPNWLVNHLTSAGHDFADNLRNETIWTKVRAKIATTGGSASVDVMIELAKSYAKQVFGLDP